MTSRVATQRWFGARPMAITVACAAFCLALTSYGREPFDGAVWRDPDRCCKEPYPRQAMADDLITTGRLVGLAREHVIALLGEPESGRSDGDTLEYFTGPERGFMPIDSEWLRIELDASGVACRIALCTD